jgi:hypothetical protein
VLWRGESLLDPALFGPVAGLGPIVILPDALGPGQPARPLTLSANHRVLIAENASALHFEEREVLAAARDLVPLGRAEWQAPRKIAWQHLLLASHEVILAEGGWCESLQPLPVVLAGCAPDARAALAGLVPDAAQASRTGPYAAARIMLRPEEAALLAHGRGIAVTQAR